MRAATQSTPTRGNLPSGVGMKSTNGGIAMLAGLFGSLGGSLKLRKFGGSKMLGASKSVVWSEGWAVSVSMQPLSIKG